MADSQSREQGSNPVWYHFEALVFSFSPQCLSSLSCINKIVAVDIGENMWVNSFCAVITVAECIPDWEKLSRCRNEQVRQGMTCKAFWAVRYIIITYIYLEVNVFDSLWIVIWNESPRFGFSIISLGYVMFSFAGNAAMKSEGSYIGLHNEKRPINEPRTGIPAAPDLPPAPASWEIPAMENITWPRLLDERPKRRESFQNTIQSESNSFTSIWILDTITLLPCIYGQVLVVEQARVFIDNLASTGENMLLNFDNFLTVDDVIKGRKFVRLLPLWIGISDVMKKGVTSGPIVKVCWKCFKACYNFLIAIHWL